MLASRSDHDRRKTTTRLASLHVVRVTICGVRGSTPSPGADFVRYGGHTSCVAVAHDGQSPTLLLDAGTGARRLSTVLGGSPLEGSFLLGHLHWDHMQGLPFTSAADRDDARVDVYAPAQPGGGTEELLGRMMGPPLFPVPPAGLRGRWRFLELHEGLCTLEGFEVLAREIPHKGGRTFGYRISDGRASLAYLSDHCPTVAGPGPAGLGAYHEAALELAAGCDLLLHDAQLVDEEVPERSRFGHASAGYACGLAARAGVRRLLLFHHDPARTDDEVDAIVASCQGAGLPVAGATEGMVLDLPEVP